MGVTVVTLARNQIKTDTILPCLRAVWMTCAKKIKPGTPLSIVFNGRGALLMQSQQARVFPARITWSLCCPVQTPATSYQHFSGHSGERCSSSWPEETRSMVSWNNSKKGKKVFVYCRFRWDLDMISQIPSFHANRQQQHNETRIPSSDHRTGKRHQKFRARGAYQY